MCVMLMSLDCGFASSKCQIYFSNQTLLGLNELVLIGPKPKWVR